MIHHHFLHVFGPQKFRSDLHVSTFLSQESVGASSTSKDTVAADTVGADASPGRRTTRWGMLGRAFFQETWAKDRNIQIKPLG